MPHDIIIDKLMAEANITLSACLMHTEEKEKQEEIKSLFQELQINNFTLMEKDQLSPVLRHLFN